MTASKSKNKGQALVDYLLLMSLVFAMVAMAFIMFEPQKKRMIESFRNSLKQVISTGSPDYSVRHPLLDKRVVEIK